MLPGIIEKILKEYSVKTLYFARGPGSFMSIKITYIFLKTLSIVKNVKLKAADGFNFNGSKPIKAVGNLYFIKEDGVIKTKKMDIVKDERYELPKKLDYKIFSEDNEPLYILPAV